MVKRINPVRGNKAAFSMYINVHIENAASSCNRGYLAVDALKGTLSKSMSSIKAC